MSFVFSPSLLNSLSLLSISSKCVKEEDKNNHIDKIQDVKLIKEKLKYEYLRICSNLDQLMIPQKNLSALSIVTQFLSSLDWYSRMEMESVFTQESIDYEKKHQSVAMASSQEELLQLQSQIDEEFNQRLTYLNNLKPGDSRWTVLEEADRVMLGDLMYSQFHDHGLHGEHHLYKMFILEAFDTEQGFVVEVEEIECYFSPTNGNEFNDNVDDGKDISHLLSKFQHSSLLEIYKHNSLECGIDFSQSTFNDEHGALSRKNKNKFLMIHNNLPEILVRPSKYPLKTDKPVCEVVMGEWDSLSSTFIKNKPKSRHARHRILLI